MAKPVIIRFRADSKLSQQLKRLRKERSINVSDLCRRLVQRGIEQEFPDVADVATEGHLEEPHESDQKQTPGVATETTNTDSQTTPAEVVETPQHDSNASPSVATEDPEQPPARAADAHENGQTQVPGVAAEATETDSQTTPAEVAETPQNDSNASPSVAAEDTAQMTPIPGWKPCKLPGGQWGALLKGPGVAGLPDDNQLPGTPIVVTDKRGESWTTTLTEVVDRTDNAIVVKNSGRSRS